MLCPIFDVLVYLSVRQVWYLPVSPHTPPPSSIVTFLFFSVDTPPRIRRQPPAALSPCYPGAAAATFGRGCGLTPATSTAVRERTFHPFLMLPYSRGNSHFFYHFNVSVVCTHYNKRICVLSCECGEKRMGLGGEIKLCPVGRTPPTPRRPHLNRETRP